MRAYICRLYSHLKANENYFLVHVYIYIYTEGPKKCPMLFEHLYLPFKLSCFKSVCCKRSLYLCIVVGYNFKRLTSILKSGRTVN